MAASTKKRNSLARRDPSRISQMVREAVAVFDNVPTPNIGTNPDQPPIALLNGLLVAIGVRALITGVALTLIAPTVPVFVGVNVLLGAPVVVRYASKRRAETSGGFGDRTRSGVGSRTATVVDAVRTLADRPQRGRYWSPRGHAKASRGRDRLSRGRFSRGRDRL